MTVKSLAFKPHLSPAYWAMACQHCAFLHNITSGNNTSSPYILWHNKLFDLLSTPILPFESIVADHRPLAHQIALSGRSIEAVFVGTTPDFTAGIVLFNPKPKRTFIRQSFKYLSDAEPISTSYIVTDSTPAGGEVLADLTSTDDPAHSSISSQAGDPHRIVMNTRMRLSLLLVLRLNFDLLSHILAIRF